MRATTRLVVLDIVALNDKGEPVRDLKAEDFTVLDDGKPQKISHFSLHQSPASATEAASRLAPNVISNAAACHRLLSGTTVAKPDIDWC